MTQLERALTQAQRAPVFEPERPDIPGNIFARALTARILAALRGTSPSAIALAEWPSDRGTAAWLARAASAPAMTSVAGWAAELVQRTVLDALEALGPASAGAELLRRGLVLTSDGGLISAPGFVAEFGNAGFVAEGNPIPVHQGNAMPAILNPHKLGAIAVLTRQMVEGSNAEALITDTAIRAAGRMLDEVLFDANPADAARPAGLRYGIAASTPSNNASTSEAFYEDIGTLFNELAPVAGNGPYVLVMAPGRAMMFNARNSGIPTGTNVVVLGSSAVINDVLAIAPAALVAALSPDPQVEVSRAATLHMDTAPQAVGSVAPHRSLWQSDSIAIKVRWPVTWVLRDPRGFAWLTPTWK